MMFLYNFGSVIIFVLVFCNRRTILMCNEKFFFLQKKTILIPSGGSITTRLQPMTNSPRFVMVVFSLRKFGYSIKIDTKTNIEPKTSFLIHQLPLWLTSTRHKFKSNHAFPFLKPKLSQ